jgi:hypothetical protein
VLGSLGAIGGGVGRGVGGLATGIAGYGRQDRTDYTFFGVDLGEKAENLKKWGQGEKEKLEHEREKHDRKEAE